MNLTKSGIAAAGILAIGAALVGCMRQESGSTSQVATVAIAAAPATASTSAGSPIAAPGSTDDLPVVVITASRTAPDPIVLSQRDPRSSKY